MKTSRYFSIALIALLTTGIFSNAAMAQVWRYYTQYRNEFQQAAAQANASLGVVQSLQNQITTQRANYQAGMASQNQQVRYRARQTFQTYLGNLMRVYLNAENAYNRAIGAGQRYYSAAIGRQSTSAEGPGIAAQLQTMRNIWTNLRNTRGGVERELQDVNRRY